MSKRSAKDVNDEVLPLKKQNFITALDEVEEELLKENQRFEELKAVLTPAKSKIANLRKMASESLEKRSIVVELKTRLESFKEELMLWKSTKNRLLNPVQLSFDLYTDVFHEYIHQRRHKKLMEIKLIVRYMMIGKEASFSVIQVLKQSIKLRCFHSINIELVLENDISFLFDYNKFTEKLLHLIVPLMTEIGFYGDITGESHHLFFQALAKNQNQKKLKIIGFEHINNFFIEALQSLNDKNIPVELCYPSKEIVANLSGVKFDVLKINYTEDWINFLVSKSFSCLFSKLDISDVNKYSLNKWKENVVIDYVEELLVQCDLDEKLIFDHFKKYFPNVKKLIVNYDNKQEICCNFFRGYLEGLDLMWMKAKDIIENAPQQEIIVNYNYDTFSKQQYELMIFYFDGEKIDDKTLRWISENNKLKVINFHHELKTCHMNDSNLETEYESEADTDPNSLLKSDLDYDDL